MINNNINEDYRNYCGYIAILGRTNVGKSTLLNNLIGQKISITSRKPQTTRHRLLGINTDDNYQMIYVDTPGMQDAPKDTMGKSMNKETKNAIAGIDLLIYMVEILKWTDLDEHLLKMIKYQTTPVILVINKIDRVKDKELMLPYLQKISEKKNFVAIIPVSALSRKSLLPLKKCIKNILPAREFQYDSDQITDKNKSYFAAEFIREKLIKRLGAELPYSTTVTIDSFSKKGNIFYIDAIVWVTKKNQKSIVIGKKGLVLKAIGGQARKEMEIMFNDRVWLNIWVKVKEKCGHDQLSIGQLGSDC